MKPSPLRLKRATSIQIPFICSHCIGRIRPATSAHRYRSYSTAPPQPPASGFTQLQSRRLISLQGPDTTKFLQGLITANITSPNPKSSNNPRSTGFYTSFLNGQGRLLHDVFIYPQLDIEGGKGDGWYIEIDANEAERFAKYIKRYRLRAKVDVRLLDEGEMGVWSLWDEGGGWTAYSFGHSGSVNDSAVGTKVDVGCEDHRAPGMGRRLLLPGSQKPDVEMEESNEEAYRVRRYLRGVPEGQDELLREHALPQESNVDFMGGIDYRKGCYVGQELTIRTHHTGVVRKRVLPVMIYPAEETEPELLEYLPEKEGLDASVIPAETNFGRSEKKGRSAGKWLRGVGNLGLGLCRIEIMTDAVVQGGTGGYKKGDEFKLEWEVEGEGVKMVKAKAFVPPWHLTRQKGVGKL